MAKPKNITGRRFGRLIAIKPVGKSDSYIAWLCQCDCGAQKALSSKVLLQGLVRSCGCLRSEKSGERKRTHGMSRTPTHIAWSKMLERCNSKNDKHYRRYGARGITVCERWLKFENFLADMGKRPKTDKPRSISLDRINNDGNYEPGNCRWATAKQQALNTSRNIILTAHGQTMHINEWAEATGYSVSGLKKRLSRGMNPEQALVPMTQAARRRYKKLETPSCKP